MPVTNYILMKYINNPVLTYGDSNILNKINKMTYLSSYSNTPYIVYYFDIYIYINLFIYLYILSLALPTD